VLGVTLVLADGTIASAGGKVVKNVAGYDLARLVCGSGGRLALIGRASFRLHPLPKTTRTLLVETDDAPAAVAALGRSQLQPSALDVLYPGRVAVLFEGSARAVEAQLATARGLVGGEESGPEIWDETRARQGAARGSTHYDPGRLAELLAGLTEAIVRPSAGTAFMPDERRRSVAEPVSPEAAALSWLQERIRHAFDPKDILAT
jgi:glycolate oxidase FAD binding subunit